MIGIGSVRGMGDRVHPDHEIARSTKLKIGGREIGAGSAFAL